MQIEACYVYYVTDRDRKHKYRLLIILELMVVLSVTVYGADPVHGNGSTGQGPAVKADGVQAVRYLERYGYLSKRSSQNETHSTVDRDHAIRTFQKFANVTETGKIDTMTSHLMSQPRCGFLDILPNTDRTLPLRIVDPPKWQSKVVKWRITKFSKKLTVEEQREAIENGYRHWSENSGLSIAETDGEDYDVDIQFVRGEHGDGKYNAFDGKGQAIAHAFLPPDGDVHFDEDESWMYHSNTGTELEMTAIHELGHSLGLIHSLARESIMAPFYKAYRKGFELHPMDILAIQELYGPPTELHEQQNAPLLNTSVENSTAGVSNANLINTTTESPKITNTTTASKEVTNTTTEKQITNNTMHQNNTTESPMMTNTTTVSKIVPTTTMRSQMSNNTIQMNNTTVKPRKKKKKNKKKKNKGPFDICKARFDAICGGKDGYINLFVGRYIYKLYSYCPTGQSCILPGYPKLIRAVYKKGPKRVHAAAYIPDVRKRTYLFKGRKMWRYTGKKLDPGYPIKLKQSDLPYKPSAVYVQKTQYADYSLYLFSGNYFWEMNLYTNRMAHSKFFINTYWDHMPKKPDAIIQAKDGNIYVFKGKFYRKYDYRRAIVSRKNLKAPAWIGIQCGEGDKDQY